MQVEGLRKKNEMSYSAEQMIATRQAMAQALGGLTSRVYAGFEQLSELNRATSKAMVAGSLSPTQALLAAKNPLQLLVLQVGLIRPLTEKCVVYGRHVYTVALETGGEFTKALDAKKAVEVAESNYAAASTATTASWTR